MNIFYTSNSPAACAQNLDDKRVVKMVLETAQILSAAAARHGVSTTYRPTHTKHPSVLWAGENRANYQWTLNAFICLAGEYSYRYYKIHKSMLLFEELHAAMRSIPDGKFFEPPACTPGVDGLPHQLLTRRYQLYMATKWLNDKRPPVWTKRGIPEFFIEVRNHIERPTV